MPEGAGAGSGRPENPGAKSGSWKATLGTMPSAAEDLRGDSSPIAPQLRIAKETLASLGKGCSFLALSAEQLASITDPVFGFGAFRSRRANTAPQAQAPAASSRGDERDFVEMTISVQRNQPSAEMTDDLRQLTTATATARAGGLTPAMAYAAQ